MSTHCRNVILKRRRITSLGIPATPPGEVEDLLVVTDGTDNSGAATGTWTAPEGSTPGNLDYIITLTGGPGTVEITSITVS